VELAAQTEERMETNRLFQIAIAVFSSVSVIIVSLLFPVLLRLLHEGGWVDLYWTHIILAVAVIADLVWLALISLCLSRKSYSSITQLSVSVVAFLQVLLLWIVAIEIGTYVLKLHRLQ
jgi:hypothetical protein